MYDEYASANNTYTFHDYLMRAIRMHNVDRVKAYLSQLTDEQKSYINNSWENDGLSETYLKLAIQTGNPDMVLEIINAGANVNLLTVNRTKESFTPLFIAVNLHPNVHGGNNSKQKIINILLQNGADINLSDAQGITVVDAVITNDDVATARNLISSEIAINTTDKSNLEQLIASGLDDAGLIGNPVSCAECLQVV